MEPAMALAIMGAIASDDAPRPMPALAILARTLARIDGQVPADVWEDIATAGAALWSSDKGSYDAERVATGAILPNS